MSDALALAYRLEHQRFGEPTVPSHVVEAAAELRRLHAENTALRAELGETRHAQEEQRLMREKELARLHEIAKAAGRVR